VAFAVGRLPLARSLSWTDLIGSSYSRLATVFVAAATATYVVLRSKSGILEPQRRSIAIQTALDSLWLAPLALLLSEDSAWALLVTAIFVVGVVLSFTRFRKIPPPEAAASPNARPDDDRIFKYEPPARSSQQASAVAAVLCAEAGSVVASVGHAPLGALLVASGAIVFAPRMNEIPRLEKSYIEKPTPQLERGLQLFAIALAFTTAALMPYLKKTYGFAGLGLPGGHRSTRGSPGYAGQGELGGEDPMTGPRWGYTGILLWPKKMVRTKLVAPTAMFTTEGTGRGRTDLVIPFDGVYWFFQPPDKRPPRRSREAQGSPDALDIHSTDRRPLYMEARQNFGSPIDLSCCRRIQIAIRNRDRYPRTVSLELVLINTSLQGKPAQSLGTEWVDSTPAWKLYDDQPPMTETLEFAVPLNPRIRRFDEVRVVFRLDPNRADTAAKIGVEKFVLVPRIY
jgi:hypothetical protein